MDSSDSPLVQHLLIPWRPSRLDQHSLLNKLLFLLLRSISTPANEVAGRLWFYTCLWFCSRGGGWIPVCNGQGGLCIHACKGVGVPASRCKGGVSAWADTPWTDLTPRDDHGSGRYAFYWNAFLSTGRTTPLPPGFATVLYRETVLCCLGNRMPSLEVVSVSTWMSQLNVKLAKHLRHKPSRMNAVKLRMVTTEGKHNPETRALITNTEDSNHRKARHTHRGFELQDRGFEPQEGSSQAPRIRTTGMLVTNIEDSNHRKVPHKHRGFEPQEGSSQHWACYSNWGFELCGHCLIQWLVKEISTHSLVTFSHQYFYTSIIKTTNSGFMPEKRWHQKMLTFRAGSRIWSIGGLSFWDWKLPT